ncbi:MAG: carbon-nitrogen hydrolase family protein [Phototrophicaceae bacterium]
MPRSITAAAVQMDAAPAPREDRLARADALVMQAAANGAQLVALPQLFSLGYGYADAIYTLAEPMDGPTVGWLRDAAARYRVHLGGTLLIREGDHLYNRALLTAPDGRTWAYDQQHPWAWERAYFREGRGAAIAHTDLGAVGLMIGWDYSHVEAWHDYAGQVDLVLVLASAPHLPDLILPRVARQAAMFGEGGQFFRGGPDGPYGKDIDAYATWMRVPLVVSGGAGEVTSAMPRPRWSMLAALPRRPELWRHVVDAHRARLRMRFWQQAKLVDAAGVTVSRVDAPGDHIACGPLTLPDARTAPVAPPPSSAHTWLAYLYADLLLHWLMLPQYRSGIRQYHGEEMAPLDRSTRLWRLVVVAAFVIGYLLGRLRL